jgi:hypothetical protein
MELEGSLPCLQGPSTGPYPEPDESSPYHSIRISKIHFSLISYLKNRVGLWDHVAVCVCVYVFSLSLLGNGPVETLPR